MSEMNLEDPVDWDADARPLSFEDRLATADKTISKMSQELWQMSLKLHELEDEVNAMKGALTGILTGRKP